MAKFIFVTGGVVSSLGKGIASASLGAILESRGLVVTLCKLDPYINVDPGTMSPFQHGEVFVTEDGAETDLDLGHYERFTHARMTRANNFTSGQIYESVIHKERQGEYLGRTVQVIPHITNEIKSFIKKAVGNAQVAIVEIGGTVGDIESLPFLEAIRQMGIEEGRQNACFIHLTLLPYISVSGELKTKPTQHSVKELRGIGIQPDILLCRAQAPVPPEERSKIALFTNVAPEAVIEVLDADNIYKIPLMLHEQMLDEIVCHRLNILAKSAKLTSWRHLIEALEHPTDKINVAFVGKYVDLTESYKSLAEAMVHASMHTRCSVQVHYLDSELLATDTADLAESLRDMDAILVPGGFGNRGIEGKIAAIQYARTQRLPFLGICLGMQLAVVEFARNVAGMTDAHSTEFNSSSTHPVVAMLQEWVGVDGQRAYRKAALGGTMRLGAQPCHLVDGTLAHKIYGRTIIRERHRHRYEVNSALLPQLTAKGLVVGGTTPDTSLCETIELKDHPWFVGCQFHPEFTSSPREAHPLFCSFVEAAKAQRHQQTAKASVRNLTLSR